MRGRKPKHNAMVLGLEVAAARDGGMPWKDLVALYQLSRSYLARVERAARTLQIEFVDIAAPSAATHDVS